MIFLDFSVTVTEGAHYGGLLSFSTLQNTQNVKKTMDGVADDVDNEHDCADDDMEEKTTEIMEKRALVDGGGLQIKYKWKSLKNVKNNQYMQWNRRLYGGCTWR